MRLYFEIKPFTNLGNWMFQYAAAASTGLPVGVLVENDRQFNTVVNCSLFTGLPIVRTAPASAKVYREPVFSYRKLPDFDANSDVVLSGYFQSEKYFDEGKVRKVFQIPADVSAHLNEKYGDLMSKHKTVGISVRRGDYLKMAEYHPFVGKKYLVDAIARFDDLENVLFVVCSDDLPWCKSFFGKKKFSQFKFLFVENESVLAQLYIHALCNHNIVSNSSFSWWGAWLNDHVDKRVIAPSNWFGFEFVKQGLDWSDIYFKGVTVIKNGYAPTQWIWGHITSFWTRFKVFAFPWVKMLRRMKGFLA